MSFPMANSTVCGLACAAVLAGVAWFRSRNLRRSLQRYMGTEVTFEICPGKRMESGRTVLVTGGNGFVGRNIVTLLLDKKLNVVVFDLSIPGEGNRLTDVTYIRGNLLNRRHMEEMFRFLKSAGGVESVIHTASLIPFLDVPDQALWAVNVEGTKNLVEGCARLGVRTFIYTSSATIVLEKAIQVSLDLDEEDPPPKEHINTYTATKAEAERIVVAANDPDKMVTCILRPAGIFGRGDKVLADQLVKGNDQFFVGDGDALIDWVPVESIALAHVLAEEVLTNDPTRRRNMQTKAYFINNNEPWQYRVLIGAQHLNRDGSVGSKDGRGASAAASASAGGGGGLSHWGYPRPKRLPLWLSYSLAYLNWGVYTLVGVPPLSPGLAPSLIDFCRRSYTFRSARAARDFGYSPALTNAEAIRRMVAAFASERRC